ncbi:Protein Trigalactosyldiacylglycerol 1 [Chlorella vulgaris]
MSTEAQQGPRRGGSSFGRGPRRGTDPEGGEMSAWKGLCGPSGLGLDHSRIPYIQEAVYNILLPLVVAADKPLPVSQFTQKCADILLPALEKGQELSAHGFKSQWGRLNEFVCPELARLAGLGDSGFNRDAKTVRIDLNIATAPMTHEDAPPGFGYRPGVSSVAPPKLPHSPTGVPLPVSVLAGPGNKHTQAVLPAPAATVQLVPLCAYCQEPHSMRSCPTFHAMLQTIYQAGYQQGAAAAHHAQQLHQAQQASGGSLAPQRLSLAALHRRRAPAAARSIATVDGGSGGPAGAGGNDKVTVEQLVRGAWRSLCSIRPPKSLWRTVGALVLGGQALVRILQGKIHWKNTTEQLDMVGPRSLGVCLLTAAFVGMVFTIQFIRQFAKLGLTKSVGGVLALALSRELTPVVTSIIVAGRVSEQTDSLRVLGSDPVDYLITPRVMACMIAAPILNLACFCMGLAASVFLAEVVYDVPCNVILDSAMRAISAWDIVTSMIKCWVFGTIIATVSCAWGYTTTGGAKGVGESTTSAVVISLVLIFVFDFALSLLFFSGTGDSLRACMAIGIRTRPAHVGQSSLAASPARRQSSATCKAGGFSAASQPARGGDGGPQPDGDNASKLPQSRDEAVQQAAAAISAQLAGSTKGAGKKGFAGASSCRKLSVDVPVLESGPEAMQQLAQDILAALPKPLRQQFTVVSCGESSSSNSSGSGGVPVLGLQQCLADGRDLDGCLLITGPTSGQLDSVMRLLAYWRGPAAILLNAEWTAEQAPMEQVAFIKSFETIYCFLPLMVKVLFIGHEGAVFKWCAGGNPASTPWRIFGMEGKQMEAIGRMQQRPTQEDLEAAFYNAFAVNNQVSRATKFVTGIFKKKK